MKSQTMILQRLLLLLVLTASIQPGMLKAQSMPSEKFVAESIRLQTDRPMYITGEVAWFKLFAFDAKRQLLSDYSRVAYLELISREGNPVSRVKVELEAGCGAGAIELPDALPSGDYTLRAYTQGMRNFSDADFGRNKLIIINPQQPLVQAKETETATVVRPEAPGMEVSAGNWLQVNSTIAKNSYGQRELVTLEITTTDGQGKGVPAEVSLSIARKSMPGISLFNQGTSVAANTAPLRSVDLIYQPENMGMDLEGKVVNESTREGAAGVEVILAFPGKTSLVYGTLTDANGRFSFLLPKLFGLRQVVVQIHSEEMLPVVIELDDPFQANEPGNTEPFRLDPEWVPIANELLVNAQLKEAYRNFEAPPVFTTKDDFENLPFFGQPDVQYKLDDYTRFPLPEFFFEVVNEVWVKGKYGQERVEVTHTEQDLFDELPPLLLVDGVPVFDQSVFLKINNKLIASTEIVIDPFWLNPSYYKGIIQLTSFEGDARCFKLPENAIRRSFLTFLPQREFSRTDYSAASDDRLPDFLNTLYWDPSVKTDDEGKAVIQFYTSDATGDFEIRVEGFTQDGKMGAGSTQFEVVREDN
ncbi:MAG: hypothetical protein R2824_01405 [Saprospiraceae bacterium]|nr:hypothetical protein [Lewinella sp.]